MYVQGKLFVFVLKDELTNEIRAVCEDLETAKKAEKDNEKWQFPDVKIDCYRVKSVTDFNFMRSA